jgi:hypothetical protein
MQTPFFPQFSNQFPGQFPSQFFGGSGFQNFPQSFPQNFGFQNTPYFGDSFFNNATPFNWFNQSPGFSPFNSFFPQAFNGFGSGQNFSQFGGFPWNFAPSFPFSAWNAPFGWNIPFGWNWNAQNIGSEQQNGAENNGQPTGRVAYPFPFGGYAPFVVVNPQSQQQAA